MNGPRSTLDVPMVPRPAISRAVGASLSLERGKGLMGLHARLRLW